MTCEGLFSKMGFSCLDRGDGLYLVETPLSFPDGEPISLYFQQRGGSVIISDNADTIFHLHSSGMDLSDRKKWRGLHQIVSSFGMTLRESGEVSGDALAAGAGDLVARYIGAMLAVADLEREHFGISEELSKFLDEVEDRLRALRPQMELVRRVVTTGHSGRRHFFDFRFGDDFIDAARPHSIRTGSILRKAADIQNTENPARVMVIMDDREDPDRAKAETDILSTLVTVLPFTQLEAVLPGGFRGQSH